MLLWKSFSPFFIFPSLFLNMDVALPNIDKIPILFQINQFLYLYLLTRNFFFPFLSYFISKACTAPYLNRFSYFFSKTTSFGLLYQRFIPPPWPIHRPIQCSRSQFTNSLCHATVKCVYPCSRVMGPSAISISCAFPWRPTWSICGIGSTRVAEHNHCRALAIIYEITKKKRK